jgi:chaperone modulatory protein CbpM
MQNDEAGAVVAVEAADLTLEELAAACAVEAEWVIERVREGLLRAMDGPASAWRFTSADMLRARRMLEVERAFDAAPELAALVADLLEELDTLRARLSRAGLL